MRSAAYRPQAGFPPALYENDSAQMIFLRGISFHVGHRHDGLAPAALTLVRSAAALLLSGCVYRSCADAAYSLSMARMAQHDILAAVPA